MVSTQLLGPLRRYFPYHPRPTFKTSFRLHTPKHPRVPETRFISYWSLSLHSWCWANSIYQSGNVFVALGRRRFHLRHWYPRHDLCHSDCHEPWFTKWTSQSHRFACPPFPFQMTCFCEVPFILIVVLWVWAPHIVLGWYWPFGGTYWLHLQDWWVWVQVDTPVLPSISRQCAIYYSYWQLL